jgi:hypothetical protein
MNDIRGAIERVTAQFDLPNRGLGDLARRRDRVRTRRRIATGALALAVATGGAVFAAQAFIGTTPGPHPPTNVAATSASSTPATTAATTATTTAGAGVQECPTPSGDSPPEVILSSKAGPAGSSVDVSGTLQTGDRFLQLWWNAADDMPDRLDNPPWPPTGPDLRLHPAGPGPLVKLAAIPGPAATGGCSFRTEFTVPDVDPGTYQVVWVIGAAKYPPGYSLFDSPTTFEVTG